MSRLLVPFVVFAAVLGCQAPPAAEPVECPTAEPVECPTVEPVECPTAVDAASSAAELEACRARLRACEQDPFKGSKYFIGDEPEAPSS